MLILFQPPLTSPSLWSSPSPPQTQTAFKHNMTQQNIGKGTAWWKAVEAVSQVLLRLWHGKANTEPTHTYSCYSIFVVRTYVQFVQPIERCKYCHITSEDNIYLWWTIGNSFTGIFSPDTLSSDWYSGRSLLMDLLALEFWRIFCLWASTFELGIYAFHATTMLQPWKFLAFLTNCLHLIAPCPHTKYAITQWEPKYVKHFNDGDWFDMADGLVSNNVRNDLEGRLVHTDDCDKRAE